MLDVLDKELEKRGHHFVRYADDCNIYVRSQRAGERVMTSIELFLTKHLKLTVNKAKSAVAAPQVRKFLGFSFTSGTNTKRRLAPASIGRRNFSGGNRLQRTQENGSFFVPGFAKFVVIKRPATKARKGVNPFTKEPTVFKAKPARKIIRARPVKGAKDAVS
jgi:hypothetical protein